MHVVVEPATAMHRHISLECWFVMPRVYIRLFFGQLAETFGGQGQNCHDWKKGKRPRLESIHMTCLESVQKPV